MLAWHTQAARRVGVEYGVEPCAEGERMDFYAVLDEIRTLLQRRGRVTYRALKVQFQLDDEHLEALKEELIEAEQLAVDEQGKVLVWTGAPASAPASLPATDQEQAPLSYTP